jgi:hypothetical protein
MDVESLGILERLGWSSLVGLALADQKS